MEQGVTKRCRLSWLTNSALVYGHKCRGREFGDPTSYLTYALEYRGAFATDAFFKGRNVNWRIWCIFSHNVFTQEKMILGKIVLFVKIVILQVQKLNGREGGGGGEW